MEIKMLTVGITGLGLIGGSAAKAYKENGNARVYGYDRDEKVLAAAINIGALDGVLTKENIASCDVILVALYPMATYDYILEIAPLLGEKNTVIDLCGVKGYLCERLFKVAREHGFLYVGGHPMAGKHVSGFYYSDAELFRNASMVIVPENENDADTVAKVTKLLEPLNFGNISVTTAKRHDEIIAFTSQLAHVVSNAYVKSPTAKVHKGFSAGSYKDLTRVAYLNETMWTELFLCNKDALTAEIDCIIENLKEYSDAMKNNDADKLKKLLYDGKVAKEMIDGKKSV